MNRDELIALYWVTAGDNWAIPEDVMVKFGRAVEKRTREIDAQAAARGSASDNDRAAIRFPHDGAGKSEIQLSLLIGRREGYVCGAWDQRERDARLAEIAGQRPEAVPIDEAVRRHAYIKGREVAASDIAAAIRASS